MRRKIYQSLLVVLVSAMVLATAALLTLGVTYSESQAASEGNRGVERDAAREPYVEAYNQNNLIRFHVIANSDSDFDQALKRRVRDRVVQNMSPEFARAESLNEARTIAAGHLADIKAVAEQVVADWGESYPVAVQLGRFDFPIKTYGDLTLPAGRYEAVRVVLGEGQGANWWCVLFPPLCFVDVGKDAQTVHSAEATDQGTASDAARPKVEVRFKLLEVLGLSRR